jgi:DNA-binding transcriptional LysR family regulator
VELLDRTTRPIEPSEAGERYAAACRGMLTELEEADILAAGPRFRRLRRAALRAEFARLAADAGS